MPTSCVPYWIVNACSLCCHLHVWFSQLEQMVSLNNKRTKKSKISIDLWNPAYCVNSHLALMAVWKDCCNYCTFLKHLTWGLLNIKYRQEEFWRICIPYSQSYMCTFTAYHILLEQYRENAILCGVRGGSRLTHFKHGCLGYKTESSQTKDLCNSI